MSLHDDIKQRLYLLHWRGHPPNPSPASTFDWDAMASFVLDFYQHNALAKAVFLSLPPEVVDGTVQKVPRPTT